MSLDLATAQAILDAALAEARQVSARPLALIVLDAGGHPIAFARQDGASLFRFEIARAKAMGALGMGDDTSAIATRAATNPVFFQSLAGAVGGQIAYSPGGVLARSDGRIIGAVGVSGDTGPCDEQCAIAGLRAAGLYQEAAA